MPLPSLTNEEAKRRACIEHEDRYDYSQLNVEEGNRIVTIICRVHGSFLQNIYNHLSGYGCKKCGRQRTTSARTKSNDLFLEKANEVHKGIYQYPEPYKTAKTYMNIICPEHGEFLQTPDSHLRGSGCPKCGKERRILSRMLTQEEAYAMIHEVHWMDPYTYPNFNYTGRHNEILFVCSIHGEKLQEFGSHVSGSGCDECGTEQTAASRRIPNDLFLERANEVHKGIYQYPEPCKGVDTPIHIICPKHGEFLQTPYNHTNRKHGCSSCLYKTAAAIRVLLDDNYDKVEERKRFGWLRNTSHKNHHLECDLIANEKVCVEVDGGQHFRQRKGWAPFDPARARDKLKTDLLLEHGIHVIRVEQEFYARNEETLGRRLVEKINACLIDEVPKLHLIASSDDIYNYLL